MFVTINHQGVNSYPLSTVTNANGIWFVNLTDLKDSSTGNSLPSSEEDQVIIEVCGGIEWQKEDSTRLVSDLAEESGYTLTVPCTPIIPPKVLTPVLSPATGSFTILPVSVTITCDTPGALIHYTTDGSDPSGSSPAYASPMILNLTETATVYTVKAKGFKSEYTPSETATGTYTYTPPLCEQVATPVFSPASGNFTDSIIVEISCATAEATIYYTKDGSEPTESSMAYTGPLTLTKTRTVKAKAFKTGCNPSEIATSGVYTKRIKVNPPVISPPVPHNFSDSMSVSMSCSTEGAVIRYTTDGNEPTDNSASYATPVILTKTTTVKARGFKSDCTPSDTVSITITAKVATPVLSPAPGTFSNPITVSLSCATQDAVIRYTTDGSEPTVSSPAYAAALTTIAGQTIIIKAKGFKDGCNASDTVSGAYTILPKVETPVLSPASGSATSVKITCKTPGATIRYTTDGTEPTETSLTYSTAVTVTKNITIKAKGFKGDYTKSDTVSGTFAKPPVSQPPLNNFTFPSYQTLPYSSPSTLTPNQTAPTTPSSNWLNSQSIFNPNLLSYQTLFSGLH